MPAPDDFSTDQHGPFADAAPAAIFHDMPAASGPPRASHSRRAGKSSREHALVPRAEAASADEGSLDDPRASDKDGHQVSAIAAVQVVDASASDSLGHSRSAACGSDYAVPFVMGEDGEELDLAAARMSGLAGADPPATLSPSSRAFQEHVLSICQEVSHDLCELPFCAEVSVEMWDAPCIVVILATIVSGRQQHNYRQLIRTAQQAIINRTGRSAGACLLGYKTTPFVETCDGFQARLAEVVPRRYVCLQFHKRGVCNRGAACRYQHPTDIVTVNLAVVAAVGL